MGHVYACSDLHGVLRIWKQIVNFLQPDDKIFVLGDCTDRGPQPWRTLKAVLQEPRAILLKGNHEDMLIKVLSQYFSKGSPNYYDEMDLLHNGGGETYSNALADPNVKDILARLSALPTYMIYTNADNERVILSHAGFTPWKADFEEIGIPPAKDLIWDRDHILDAVDDDWVEDVVIVHGHTPIPLMPIVPRNAELHGAYWYAENRKVCIDTGAVWTGEAVLLDLDTWDEHIFN